MERTNFRQRNPCVESSVSLFIFFVVVCWTCATALAQRANVSANGKTTVDGNFANSSVEVVLTTHEIRNGTPASPSKPQDSACTMSRFPCIALDSLSISVNGQPLFVPRSALCDLSDLLTAELSHHNSAWTLRLDGGDASESYWLNIEFDKSSIHRRALFDRESGQKLQETIFYDPE
jgi:hypothetical protein